MISIPRSGGGPDKYGKDNGYGYGYGDGFGYGYGDGHGKGDGYGYGFGYGYGAGPGPLFVTNDDTRRTNRIFRCAGCIGGYECSIHGVRL